MRLENQLTQEKVSVYPYLNSAKRIKLYPQMMEIMIKKCFKNICHKDIEFTINLCYEDIANESFKEFIYSHIKECNDSKNIVFEILESDFIEDFSIVEEFAKVVRSYGCKIAIDDFGSGYSNMENILKLKPEIIKIDGSLIKDINTSNQSKTIVKNIINMAKDLGSLTVAEFVHNKEVFESVQELGVDFLQGFYLGKPKSF